jgi:hypothetical protein
MKTSKPSLGKRSTHVGRSRYKARRNGTFCAMRERQIEDVGDFKKLTAWRGSQELVACIYRLTKSFPVQERYGLSSQMRRAAVSVSANLQRAAAREMWNSAGLYVLAWDR